MATRNRRLLLCGPAFPPFRRSTDSRTCFAISPPAFAARGWLVDTLLWPAGLRRRASQPMQAGARGLGRRALARTSTSDSSARTRSGSRCESPLHDRSRTRAQASAVLDRGRVAGLRPAGMTSVLALSRHSAARTRVARHARASSTDPPARSARSDGSCAAGGCWRCAHRRLGRFSRARGGTGISFARGRSRAHPARGVRQRRVARRSG